MARGLEFPLLVLMLLRGPAASSKEESGFVLVFIFGFFPPPKALVSICYPSGGGGRGRGAHQTAMDSELMSEILGAEAVLEIAGLCGEGLGKPTLSQVVGVYSRGTTLWKEFGRFYFRSDGQALHSSQSTSGTPACGKSTGAQSSKLKGSLQQKANQPKGPPLGNCVNNSGASTR